MTTQDTMNQFNELISQASDAVLCNPACQQQRKSEELKQKYINAQENAASASVQITTSKKNYMVFTQGETVYNESQQVEYAKEAQEIADAYSENFDEESAKLNIQIDSYGGLLLNFRNVSDYFDKLVAENRQLFLELKDETNDVLTNERKTYYEDQRIDGLKHYYYYILLAIYVVCVICFVVFAVIYPSPSSFKMRLLLLVILIALPFVSSWILGNIIYVIYKLYGLLPKNVYVSANA